MGPFSMDEKSDKPRPVFHPVEDDHVDRRVATTGALRTKPGNPSTFFDHKGKMDQWSVRNFSFTGLYKPWLCSAVDRLIYNAIALRRGIINAFFSFLFIYFFYLINYNIFSLSRSLSLKFLTGDFFSNAIHLETSWERSTIWRRFFVGVLIERQSNLVRLAIRSKQVQAYQNPPVAISASGSQLREKTLQRLITVPWLKKTRQDPIVCILRQTCALEIYP